MELSPWAVAALGAVVALNTLFIAGLAVGMLLLQKRLATLLDQSEPLIQRADELLSQVEKSTEMVHVKVDDVLTRTITAVDVVCRRVDQASAAAEGAVTEPLVGAASLLAGIKRGVDVYTQGPDASSPPKSGPDTTSKNTSGGGE